MSKGAVLILGARSDIARACARAFAAKGHPIQLAARDSQRLEADRADLETRYGVAATLHEVDALTTGVHGTFVAGLPDLPEIAVCAIGVLGDQEAAATDPRQAEEIYRANLEGPASLLTHLANGMEARGTGTLVGISSVAGDRGRASNYVYGAAKAGFTAYLSGLRNRLTGTGVHVVTVLPGFVATAMTEGMETPAPLTAEPDAVAAAILRAVERQKNVIYVKPIWRLVMAVIRNIPEPVFKKTRL